MIVIQKNHQDIDMEKRIRGKENEFVSHFLFLSLLCLDAYILHLNMH